MFELDPNELTHPATQFIDHLEHELVTVGVHAVEELLEFLICQVPYRLSEPFIFSGRFHI